MLYSSEERATPGASSPGLLQEHINRYLFAAQFVQGRTVLAAACGAGYGAPIFWSVGARSYCGVDISESTVTAANARYAVADSIRFCQGDVSRLDCLANESIDVAISFETIEHVPDPEGMLKNMHRVLKPGGLFVVSTPNRTYCRPVDTIKSVPLKPFHLREWSHEEFVELFSLYFRLRSQYGQFLTKSWRIAIRRTLIRCGLFPIYLKLKRPHNDDMQVRVQLPEELWDWGKVEQLTQKQTANYLIFIGTKVDRATSSDKWESDRSLVLAASADSD
jgi:ubiquinone/menaquinone biosynthesis C-methylase UbiE